MGDSLPKEEQTADSILKSPVQGLELPFQRDYTSGIKLHILEKCSRSVRVAILTIVCVCIARYTALALYGVASQISINQIATDPSFFVQTLLIGLTIAGIGSVYRFSREAFNRLRPIILAGDQEFENWIIEFYRGLFARSRNSMLSYSLIAAGVIISLFFLLFHSTTVNTTVINHYVSLGVENPVAHAYHWFNFFSFWVPEAILFSFIIGIIFYSFSWFIVHFQGSAYVIGRQRLSSRTRRDFHKQTIGNEFQIKLDPYNSDRYCGLKPFVTYHYKSQLLMSLGIGLIAYFVFSNLSDVQVILALVAISLIPLVGFLVSSYSVQRLISHSKGIESSRLRVILLEKHKRLQQRLDLNLTELHMIENELNTVRMLRDDIALVVTWKSAGIPVLLPVSTSLVAFLLQKSLSSVPILFGWN